MSTERTAAETQKDKPDVFPIVGIGASAGGLEAFERVFTQMPPDTGMAFIIVQHLDPNHNSMLAELIKRYTEMSVLQAKDNMQVQPNKVYIIPPNRNMALEDGKLILTAPSKPRGFRLPIDYFFRSLAQDQGEHAICVVLSGAASDGTLGVKAIKGEGGMAMAQSPETARYPSMPQSAIATGMVDFILPPEEIPGALMTYVKQAVISVARGERVIPPSESDLLTHVFVLLRNHTGHDFSQYKRNTLIRRIERRMVVSHRKSLADYLEFLQQNPLEVETLFKEMLIGVTRFFRDDDAFQIIANEIVPTIVTSQSDGDVIRVWVAGCSTGEEAYSLAMLFYDAVNNSDKFVEIQIFATDIDKKAIEKARAAYYPDNIAADVPPDLLKRHFSEEQTGYRLKKHIRNIVLFAEQSLIKDPPFSRLDLITCRNLLIYLNLEIQKRVIQLFHYALRTNGYLFLGTSETLTHISHLFETVDKKWKIYRRLEGVSRNSNLNFGAGIDQSALGSVPVSQVSTFNVEAIARQALLKRYTYPAVIINEHGDILYFHEDSSDYLQPAMGTASFNILKMIVSDLRLSVSTGLRRVLAQRREVAQEPISVQAGGASRQIQVVLQPLRELNYTELLILVAFEEVADDQIDNLPAQSIDLPEDQKDQRILELEQDLRSTREYLQTTIEELETSNEELKSANEELQSSNEEFQSTNEELETTKEELQSVNEELVTVNSELAAKIDELIATTNNQKNLMDNMDIGLIFLSDNLLIRLFNPIASSLLNLIPDDVGRPIRHFAANFDYRYFNEDCERVLDTLEPIVREIYSTDDRWFIMQLHPYRRLDSDIDGLVVTFADITAQKIMQQALESREEIYETLLEHLPETAVIIFDSNLQYTMVGGEALVQAGFSPETMIGRNLYDVLPQKEADELAYYYRAALRGERSEYIRVFNGRKYRNIAAPVMRVDGTILAGMIVAIDIGKEDTAGSET